MTGDNAKPFLEEARDLLNSAAEAVGELERGKQRAERRERDWREKVGGIAEALESVCPKLRAHWEREPDQDRRDALYPILQRLEGELERIPVDPDGCW